MTPPLGGGRLGCHEEGWLSHKPVSRFLSCLMLRGPVKTLNNKNSTYNINISFNQSYLLTFCPICLNITSVYIFFWNHLKIYCLHHTLLPLNFSVCFLFHQLGTIANFRQYNDDAVLKLTVFTVCVLGFLLTHNVFYRISSLPSIKEFQSRIIYWI